MAGKKRKKTLVEANREVALSYLEDAELSVPFPEDDSNRVKSIHTLNEDIIKMTELELKKQELAYKKLKDANDEKLAAEKLAYEKEQNILKAKADKKRDIANAVMDGLKLLVTIGGTLFLVDVENKTSWYNSTSAGKDFLRNLPNFTGVFKKK